jgi:hypothetical protein
MHRYLTLGSVFVWGLVLCGCPGKAIVVMPHEGDGAADATNATDAANVSEQGSDDLYNGSTDATGGQDGSACAAICQGCCTEDGTCTGGADDQACGMNGVVCADCTLTGQECTGSICAGPCISNCTEACNGGSDGCGGTCSGNTCTGCCDGQLVCRKGTANGLCGTGGETCDNCLATGLTCVEGDCICVADCANACQGEDDGCGGTCPQHTCKGCCNESGVCQSGTSSTACGSGGGACTDCTTSGLVCSGGQCACIPDCQGKCAGADDGCGNPCSKNHCSGCCDDALECQTGKNDTVCGNGGASCMDCTLQGQTCTGGHCAS